MIFNLVCMVVIFLTSLAACMFPAMAGLPPRAIYVARHFGTGVIIATALMHLLEPASDSLSDDSLDALWTGYPFAYAFCIIGLLITTLGDILSRRHLDAYGISHNHGPGLSIELESKDTDEVIETHPIGYQISGLIVLEVGIVLHSLFIGLSLATTDQGAFALALAVVFHQTFEGFGLGARLTSLKWPPTHSHIPKLLALLYAATTPIGMLIGMLLSSQYDEDSPVALLVTGICDALSAGILLYTGLVELLGNEIINAKDLGVAPLKDVLLAYGSVLGGCTVMAFLALWI